MKMEYNALIREYSGNSFAILARILVADLKDFPADWKIRYKSHDVDRNTTNVRDLCCNSKNPLQVYKPVKDGFPITVRKLDGSSFQIIVSASDTTKILKLKISQMDESFPPHVQELHLNRKNSDIVVGLGWMAFTMNDLGISKDSTVYLKAKQLDTLYLGVNFKPINIEQNFPRSSGHFASPPWSMYAPGINFSGLCGNPKCISKNIGVQREVIARPNAFGEVRINFAQKPNHELDCPACSNKSEDALARILANFEDGADGRFQILPKSCLLFNARSLVMFRREGEKRVWRGLFESKSKGKENDYKIIELEGKIELVETTTVEPWRSPFCCVKCDSRITFKAHELHLGCGHVYHKWCVSLGLKFPMCKVCEAKVLIVGKADDVLQVI